MENIENGCPFDETVCFNPEMTSRFFIDERVGCIAVRDREHPDYDPKYPGLHNDTADVIFYAHGSKNDQGWFVEERFRRKAEQVLRHLQSIEKTT